MLLPEGEFIVVHEWLLERLLVVIATTLGRKHGVAGAGWARRRVSPTTPGHGCCQECSRDQQKSGLHFGMDEESDKQSDEWKGTLRGG